MPARRQVRRGPVRRSGGKWGDGVRTRLRELRQAASVSQREFARRVGVDASRVTDWLSGRALPGAENLYRIAQEFSASADWLLGSGDAPMLRGQSRAPASLEHDVAAHVARELIVRLRGKLPVDLGPADLDVNGGAVLCRAVEHEAEDFVLWLDKLVHTCTIVPLGFDAVTELHTLGQAMAAHLTGGRVAKRTPAEQPPPGRLVR